MTPTTQAILFVCQVLFDFVISISIVRFMLPFSEVGASNPIVQFVLRVTSPIVLPLRRILPPIRRFDTATLVLIMVLATAKVSLTAWLLTGFWLAGEPLALWAAGELIATWVTLYFYVMIGFVLGSWLSSDPRHPGIAFLTGLIQPLLRPFRRIMPSIGGFDLTPLPVMIALQLMLILLAHPLMQAAQLQLG